MSATITGADFHLHDRFEIYFFISGDLNYLVESKVYPLKYGDLLIMNSHEIHKPSFQPDAPAGRQLEKPYERIVIHFDPQLPRLFNPSESDLLNCFVNRPKGEQNKISLGKTGIEEVLELFKKIELLSSIPEPHGNLLRLTAFIELLVCLNRAFGEMLGKAEEVSSVPSRLTPLLDYIDGNLESNLSLEILERKFFIERSYLCRVFKKSMGSSIHEYIIYKRISKAKQLLSEGVSVTDACMGCGFNDYSNFLRMFKRAVGQTPGQYRRLKEGHGSPLRSLSPVLAR